MAKGRGAKYANGNYKNQQKAYNKTKNGLKIKRAADKLNRKLGTYGNHDGLDASHTGPGKGKLEKPSINRARPRKGIKYAKWHPYFLTLIITYTT